MSNTAAYYHRRGCKPQAVTIATTHEDGTVDLLNADGEVIVTRCRMVDAAPDPGDGVATLALVAASAAPTEPVAPVGKKKKAAAVPAPEPDAAA